tara:strand:+ start:36 stop:917 length:882 start_codon:yes stop_codon:yes gene_type:complete
MTEFYIRNEGDEEARGPYNVDQLTSLIEAEKLSIEAFFYDPNSEEWVKIKDNQELMDILFPKKRKLMLKKDEPVVEPTSSEDDEEEDGDPESDEESDESTDPEGKDGEKKPQKDKLKTKKKTEAAPPKPKPLTVSDMLAQAEGREREDAKGQTPTEIKATAAYAGMIATTLLLFLSALSLGYLDIETLKTADIVVLFRSPYIIAAVVDVVLGLLLLLQVTLLYPLVRFRAALGFGFFTILYFSTQEFLLLASNILIMIALYLCTAVINKSKALVFFITGLIGAAGYAYVLFLQ